MRRAAPPSGQRSASPRLDPYGQPYPDEEDEEDESIPVPRERRRPSRTRPGDQALVSPAIPETDEEGWDDGLTVGEGDEEAPSRPGLFDGVRSFWADVRERVAARRQPISEDDEEADYDEEASAPAADDDGWDEPPYRARRLVNAPAWSLGRTSSWSRSAREALGSSSWPSNPSRSAAGSH